MLTNILVTSIQLNFFTKLFMLNIEQFIDNNPTFRDKLTNIPVVKNNFILNIYYNLIIVRHIIELDLKLFLF